MDGEDRPSVTTAPKRNQGAAGVCPSSDWVRGRTVLWPGHQSITEHTLRFTHTHLERLPNLSRMVRTMEENQYKRKSSDA